MSKIYSYSSCHPANADLFNFYHTIFYNILLFSTDLILHSIHTLSKQLSYTEIA